MQNGQKFFQQHAAQLPQQKAAFGGGGGGSMSSNSWKKGYLTLAVSQVANAQFKDEKQEWLLHTCLLGSPKMGNGYVSSAFSGLAIINKNQKWPFTPAVSEAEKGSIAT